MTEILTVLALTSDVWLPVLFVLAVATPILFALSYALRRQ